MKINKFKYIGLAVIAAIVTVTSCDDEVTVQNLNATEPQAFFTKKSDLEAASAGTYAFLQTDGLYQRFGYIFPDLLSDESFTGTDPNFQPVYEYNLSSTSELVRSYWEDCYGGIRNSNFVIGNETTMDANLEGSDYTQTDIDQAVGEAHFMLSLIHI